VAESDLLGNLQSEYVFFDGERVARKDFPGNAVSYYSSDHLKTASVITDAVGTPKSESDYYPWGGEIQFLNGDSNHYKFTGKERDSETGLDYFGARHYSNGLGRWITPDWSATPIPVPYADFGDPQTLNLYSYVRSLPTTKADLDGHGWWEKFKNSMGEAACWCEGKEAEAAKEKRRNELRVWANDVEEMKHDPKLQQSMFMMALFATGGFVENLMGDASPLEAESTSVQAYEVGTYGELSNRSVGDGLSIDHIPSNASNLVRAAEQKGAPLTPAEKAMVRNQGTEVAVPDSLHRSASPTYGGRNTSAQIQADAANPQAAAARDTKAMVNAATPEKRNAAQAAARDIQQRAAQKK
jgi:RHS repeat-associated protein